MTGHSQEAGGAIIGGTLGLIKSLTLFSFISMAAVIDTAILAAVGAVTGFLITTLLKWIKKKLT